MIPRLVKPSKSNSFFLFGARGTGKSTFIKEQFLANVPCDEVISLNLLLPEIEDIYSRNPDRLRDQVKAHKAAKPLQWVFIDEVQKVPRLLDMVHYLIEEQKIRFILTGSSARKLKKGAANLLAGRAFVYSLHPFSSFELGDLFDLNSALHWGSLPKTIDFQNDEDKTSFLKAYALTYLREEIQIEQLVRRLNPFRAFLEVAAQCNGTLLNFSSIARDVGFVDHKTVQSYFEILEDTHLGFLLPAYSKSVRKAQSANPKFYFFDTGIKRALDNTLDVILKPQTSAFGDAFEHWVVLEIFRMNQLLSQDYKLSYFQSRETGIDLILSKPKNEILVEIKSSSTVDPIKVKRLGSLAKDFPQSKAYWLSMDQTPQIIEGVHCLPWQEGIKNIFEKDIG